jgi:hypothetical protein
MIQPQRGERRCLKLARVHWDKWGERSRPRSNGTGSHAILKGANPAQDFPNAFDFSKGPSRKYNDDAVSRYPDYRQQRRSFQPIADD